MRRTDNFKSWLHRYGTIAIKETKHTILPSFYILIAVVFLGPVVSISVFFFTLVIFELERSGVLKSFREMVLLVLLSDQYFDLIELREQWEATHGRWRACWKFWWNVAHSLFYRIADVLTQRLNRRRVQ